MNAETSEKCRIPECSERVLRSTLCSFHYIEAVRPEFLRSKAESEWVTLPNGDVIRRSSIVAVWLVDPRPKERQEACVIVEFVVAGVGKRIIVDCKSVEDRDRVAAGI